MRTIMHDIKRMPEEKATVYQYLISSGGVDGEGEEGIPQCYFYPLLIEMTWLAATIFIEFKYLIILLFWLR